MCEVAVFFYQRKGHVQKCMISQAYLNCEKVRYIAFLPIRLFTSLECGKHLEKNTH